MAVASIRLEEHNSTPSLKLGWLQHPIYTGVSPVQTPSWYTHFKPSPMESSCNHERGAEQENRRPLQFAMDLTSHMDRKWRCKKTNCENRRMVATCLLFVPNPFLLYWIIKTHPASHGFALYPRQFIPFTIVDNCTFNHCHSLIPNGILQIVPHSQRNRFFQQST